MILDELHALSPPSAATCWRSISRGSARLAPGTIRIGLSATVARPERAARLSRAAAEPEARHPPRRPDRRRRWRQAATSRMLETEQPLPWAGHTDPLCRARDLRGHQGAPAVAAVRQHAQPGRAAVPGALAINEDNLPIALHHGSLDAAQRRKVEAAMAAGRARAPWCATSTLDLGIDWGDVDLVINVGAPKGASRLIQRIGRANHRLDEPSQGAAGAVQPLRGAGMPRGARRGEAGDQDAVPHPDRRARRAGPARAGAWPARRRSMPTRFTAKCAPPQPYATCRAAISIACVDFVATGGYALTRLRALRRDCGRRATAACALAHPRIAQQYRMNVGTIVDAPMIKMRLVGARGAAQAPGTAARLAGGRVLGEIEEYFVDQLQRRRHVRLRRRGAALRRHAGHRRLRLAHLRPPSRRSPPMRAASFRSRRIWPSRVREHAGRPRQWRRCPSRLPSGWRSSSARSIAAGRRRGAGRDLPARQPALLVVATRSRAGSPTRRSACC